MTFCEQQHVSLQCLLIMGIRTYLQKMNGNEDVSINVAYARRATLSEKKSGGTRIHSFPFRTSISEDTSFLDGIHIIRDGQNEIFPDYEYAAKKKIKNVQDALQEVIDLYNKNAPLYKRIFKLKVRETEFEKNTTKKIKRF